MHLLAHMGWPEIADFARNFAAMIRVQGPDPKGLKMRKHAFHHYHSGKTTISASGMLLPDSLLNMHNWIDNSRRPTADTAVVVTVASIIEPFLSQRQRENISEAAPELIPDVQIEVMIEDKVNLECSPEDSEKRAPHWLAAQLLALVDVSSSSLALQSLIEASPSSLGHGWEAGWSLSSFSNDPQVGDDAKFSIETQRLLAGGESNHPSLLGKSTTRVALLRVHSVICKDLPNITVSFSNRRGDLLLATGSPFGVLSPLHFFNSISVGTIANCYPSSSSRNSLLMADIRCLPGMEGSPVFGEHSRLIGILTKPLRQRSSGAEIQLVIPWEAIATACTDLLLKEHLNAGKEIHSNNGNFNAVGTTCLSGSRGSDGTLDSEHSYPVSVCPLLSLVEKALASVCLVTVDDGVWASGVLLNNKGLILTNAHLLEPWRFRKGAVNSERIGNNSELFVISSEESILYKQEEAGEQRQGLLPKTYNVHRNIRVRLDHVYPWIWHDARVVYISQGPLDIALLQLNFVPDHLCPIVMDFACPSPGSKAYVIGHGLFGPRSDFFPSLCTGVVAKVVKAKMPLCYGSSLQENTNGCMPTMLETTAAVHPGGSGGAIVNSNGHMIGLVTSNARHGGGTVIPHLNFSIPCAALEPIFKFSKDMKDFSLLKVLDNSNEHLSSVWALMPPVSPKPGPYAPNVPGSLLEDKGREGKGSRFAQFIADRQEAFEKATQVSKLEKLSSSFIDSKL